MAFLEVMTRTVTPGRAGFLANNIASLDALADDDWQQMFIVDLVGRGVGWAQAQLAEHARYLTGDYIWVLDDDNVCTLPALVAELKRIVAGHDPDVIMAQTDRLAWGIFPRGHGAPAEGSVDAACAIVRRAVWLQHADAWRSARYQSDYDFIRALWDGGHSFYWWDVVASRAQRLSFGAPA